MPNFPIGPDGKYQYPRLTATELRTIYERNPCAEVRELLWEIHRLRLLLLRANQLQAALDGGCANSTEFILDIFRRELAGEPCVAERREWERSFFGPPRRSEYTRRRQNPE
ncbi:hypothetical protein [Cupriavidus sp. TMH.W2]|uniref:hypothetical protein n=1 Tax=Cupriavidus sp. TMH.W2 TaxID=3434465 RepID=UPI003D77A861